MCGITAILARGAAVQAVQQDFVPDWLHRMTRALAHRGPDGEGQRVLPHAALGHRRLSILDLASGAQPMASSDGRVQVVFNGEIYNHASLRRELEEKGASFRTRCDTEVLAEGMAILGRELPSRLRGMFAFVAHDTVSGETLLARDRVGKKPLYYTQHGDLLLVASETKSFFALPGFARDVDTEALRELLALRYVPGNRSLLRGIRELPPGHYAWHRPGEEIEARCYWRPDFSGTSYRDAPTKGSMQELASQLRERFDESVAARLESDVPLGAFLSGGVDSSGVVAAMAHAAPRSLVAVTVGFDETQVDERPHAREVAERFEVTLHEHVLRPDPERDLQRLAEICDEPLLDSSLWPTLLVSEAARREVTVALSGDGGDENFGGYRRYRFDLLEQRLRRFLPRGVASALGSLYPKADYLPRPLRMKRTLQALGRDRGAAYFRAVSSLLPEQVEALCGGPGIDPFRELRRLYDSSTAQDHETRILELDLRSNLPGDILRKVDRASMHVSLEVRAPLLDHGIVDFAASLRTELKYDRHSGKKVLREAFAPWLGREFLARKKQGFVIPLSRWLRHELREVREEAMRGRFAQSHFDTRYLQQCAREHDRGLRDHGETLWAVLMLHLWHERWGVA